PDSRVQLIAACLSPSRIPKSSGWFMAVRRRPLLRLQNDGTAANAHTVAGQWRHFTAFPYIPGVFANVVASGTAGARGGLAVFECTTCGMSNEPVTKLLARPPLNGSEDQ